MIQTFCWFNFVGAVGAIIFVDNSITNISIIVTAILLIIQRCSNISAKYATFQRKLMNKYREKNLSKNELESEFLIGK